MFFAFHEFPYPSTFSHDTGNTCMLWVDVEQVTRITSVAEMAVVAKQAEDYIRSSIKLAYNRVSPVTNFSRSGHCSTQWLLCVGRVMSAYVNKHFRNFAQFSGNHNSCIMASWHSSPLKFCVLVDNPNLTPICFGAEKHISNGFYCGYSFQLGKKLTIVEYWMFWV